MKDACVINIQYTDFNKDFNYIGFFDEQKQHDVKTVVKTIKTHK